MIGRHDQVVRVVRLEHEAALRLTAVTAVQDAVRPRRVPFDRKCSVVEALALEGGGELDFTLLEASCYVA